MHQVSPSIPLNPIELHLLCRLGILIWYMDSLHKRTNHIRQLEEAIHFCRVGSQLNREPSGKPIPVSYDFTVLRQAKGVQEATSKYGLLVVQGSGSSSCKNLEHMLQLVYL